MKEKVEGESQGRERTEKRVDRACRVQGSRFGTLKESRNPGSVCRSAGGREGPEVGGASGVTSASGTLGAVGVQVLG